MEMAGSRLEITVENSQRKLRLSVSRLRQRTEKILRSVGWRRAGISVKVVGDLEIRKLNRRFLGKDRPTDVLAFSQKEGRCFPEPERPFLGDVVVSAEMAKRVARQYGTSQEKELLLYVCHGILHLMGYRDDTAGKRKVMEEKQESILRRVWGPSWRSKNRKRSS